MDTYAELTEALSEIRVARAPAALWPSVKEFAALFGYSHLSALDLTRVGDGAQKATLYSDVPNVMTVLDREMAMAQHPLVRTCFEVSDPFLISELRNEPAHRGARWLDLIADVVRTGEGLVVPVYRAGQAIAGTHFGGAKPDVSPLTRALLQVVSHAAVDRALELRDGNRPVVNVLSVREAQCLRHVAIGRSDGEIAELLGISARTVRFHVDRAKDKLNVATRVQAVAKALRDRVIAL